ncbi:MAG TPA: four helix bundle protein [Ignavibacteriales bacterium]|jgi:four helix bundle protein|nr:four helix bundle protein [Ignavibacteriales bacterium]
MSEDSSKKIYDLEERCFQFAKGIAFFCKKLPMDIVNREYIKQLVRSSSSVGANYIEANECLGEKDFLMRLRISRKEAKETSFWLRLITETNNETFKEEGTRFNNESNELKKIFSSIIYKKTKSDTAKEL